MDNKSVKASPCMVGPLSFDMSLACCFKSCMPPWAIENTRRQIMQFALYSLSCTFPSHAWSFSHSTRYFCKRLCFFLGDVPLSVLVEAVLVGKCCIFSEPVTVSSMLLSFCCLFRRHIFLTSSSGPILTNELSGNVSARISLVTTKHKSRKLAYTAQFQNKTSSRSLI